MVDHMVEGDMAVVEEVVLTMEMGTTVVGGVVVDVEGVIPLVNPSHIGVVALCVDPMNIWHRIVLIRVVVDLMDIMVPPITSTMEATSILMLLTCTIAMEMDMDNLTTKTATTTTHLPHSCTITL